MQLNDNSELALLSFVNPDLSSELTTLKVSKS